MRKILALIIVLLLGATTVAISVEDAKQAFEQAEDDLDDAKAAWRAVQPVNIFDEEERQAGFELMKDVWTRSGTVVQKKLELAKAKVNAEPEIASDLKNEISSGVDGLVANIETWKDDVDDSETFIEFLGALRDIKDLWQEFVWKARRYYGLVVLGHTDVLVDKGLELQQLLDQKIDELEAEGEDVSELEEIYSELESNMDVVVAKSLEARNKVESITEFERSGVTFAEARLAFAQGVEAARDARDNLRDARDELLRMGELD